MRVSAPGTHMVHNYSVQTLNSAELAKKELYRELAKVSDGVGPRAAQPAHCGQGGVAGGPWLAVSGDRGAGGAAVFPLNVGPPPTAGAAPSAFLAVRGCERPQAPGPRSSLLGLG